MTDERFDPQPILDQLKDFQRASVDHAFGELYGDGADRFLVADEVGLGKTMVARGVIAQAIDHLWDDVPRIDVIYICSNASIAQQNIRRLNVMPDQGFSFSSRMTMIARDVARLEGNKVNFVSFTPGTSFDLKSSTGMGDERVLLYWLMRHVWGESFMTQPGAAEVLRCGIGEGNWPQRLRGGELERGSVDDELLAGFADDLETLDAHTRIDLLRSSYDAGTSGRAENAERDDLIGGLRQRLAARCVTSLEPDLVILDEFQRFRHLMDSEDAAGNLATQLFEHDDNKTLLLSATPYKMFTGGNDDEDHHRDFVDTVHFLFGDRAHRFDAAMSEFRRTLLNVHNSSADDIRAARNGVEHELRRVMVRTERLGADGNRNGMLTEVATDAGLEATDVADFVAMEKLSNLVGAQSMLAFWKSVPSFVNFGEGYKADERLLAALDDPGQRNEARKLLRSINSRINWRKWRAFEGLEAGNARQRVLKKQTIDNEAWRMLWLAPSLPYYELGEPWTGERLGFTKRLIFSSYVGVPRSVSSHISYEAERHMFGLREEPIENSPAGRTSVRGLLPFRRDPQGRPGAMNSFAFVYPSVVLAELGDPLGLARSAGRQLSIDEVRKTVGDRIADSLSQVSVTSDPTVQGEDARWYWAAPLLLDSAAGVTREMQHKRQQKGAWLGGATEDDTDLDESGGRTNDIFLEHLDLAKDMYRGDVPLGRQPSDLVEVLAEAALGSPGNVALRSMGHVFGDAKSDFNLWWFSARIAWAVRSLFNLPDVNSLIRSADWEQDYWRTAVSYCAEGCLTAVLDEFFHVLRESIGLFELDPDRELRQLEEFATAASEAISTRTASLAAHDHLGESDASSHRFRVRYAMRFGNDRSDDDKATATASSVRRSFNSPFWPFVLTSTSVGQEGLDFHLYCHAIMHWNLPGNPVDLEQREGRVHRYKGHAIRRNLAADHAGAAWQSDGDPWAAMFDSAVAGRSGSDNELVPYWIYPGDAKIERHVPLLPLSREVGQLAKLKRDVARYRLVFGQPRQDDLLEYIGDLPEDKLQELRIDLSPS